MLSIDDKCKKMDKMYRLNKTIQNMKQIKNNVSKIIKFEYRKRYFYSNKYYYISKINQIISNSNIISKIRYRYREIKYECDVNDYIIPIPYDSSIIRGIIKYIILYDKNNSFQKNFPNYICLGKKYYNLFNNYIKEKRLLFQKINRYNEYKNNSYLLVIKFI